MRRNILLAGIVAPFLLAGCQAPASRPAAAAAPMEVTPEEREAAARAISARIDEIIQGAKQLNVDAAIRPYSSEATFRIVDPDGSVRDFASMKATQEDAFKALVALDFRTVKQELTFLSRDLVMCTWTGVSTFELRSGGKMKIDPYVGSMLFRRQGADWNIIYAHETAAPPASVEAGR